MSTPVARWLTSSIVLTCTSALDCAAGHDVIPPSHDVFVVDAGPPPHAGAEAYEYVARRSRAVVALAEARGIETGVARAAVDRLADALDECAGDDRRGSGSTGLAGSPVEGAARVIAQIDASGAVAATQVRADPGSGIAARAIVCLVAPLKLLVFPASDGGARGIAIEAIWHAGRSSSP